MTAMQNKLSVQLSRVLSLKQFNFRRGATILVATFPVSFLTFLVIQYFQGHLDTWPRLVLKAGVIAIGLAILFSLPEKKKKYPWM